MRDWPETPLGRPVAPPEQPAPELLVAVPRARVRADLGLEQGPLPFRGEDLWNAYELGWLDARGRPRVAIAEWRVPAESPNLLESKSVKLYLQGYAMSRLESADALRERIAADLGRACGAPVAVALVSPDAPELGFGSLDGEVIDELPVALERYEDPDPGLLAADPEHPAAETLVCHLFRALCPVTGQPDHASIQIRYRGPRLERAALLRYLVAYRRHRAFHEACVERIFIDLWRRCAPRELTVYARFCRRGGIDINPFRTSLRGVEPGNPRLPRQ